jgi:4-hydroxy-tetrahydrodipicolinate synthase
MMNLSGTGVAIVTPFDTNGHVDYPALDRLVNHLSEGGVDYLVVLGTTGESATLNKEEKQKVLDFVKQKNNKQLPLVAGIGGNNTLAVIEDLKSYNLDGYSAILSVSPFYNKPTQKGIYAHYKLISENSPLPIILYNVPGRTASNISAETTIRLANDFANIIALKEASGDMNQIMEILIDKPDEFLLISGDDNLTLPMIACGCDGVISVIANSHPAIYSDMVNLALQGEFEQAKKQHFRLFQLTNLIFEEGNPGGVKYVLNKMKLMEDEVRLPLFPISSELKLKIDTCLKEI